MAKSLRIPKTLQQKLSDLDDHLFLLREQLYKLKQIKETAYLKSLSAELRVLICFSSGTEGLLWRLADELKVKDAINLHAGGKVNPDHPLARNLAFTVVPIQRAGFGPPQIPAQFYSLKTIIKHHEAVFISGKSLTHEYLIKAIAQQMGSAHEDEGVEFALDDLNQIFLGGLSPYVSTLASDAELVLQIGERTLETAEKDFGFTRNNRHEGFGDTSIVVRLGLRQVLAGKIPLFLFESWISEIQVTCEAGPQSLVFNLLKGTRTVKSIWVEYPKDWNLNTDAVFVFQYSSKRKQAHAMTNGEHRDNGIDCDMGWLIAEDLNLRLTPVGQFVYRQFALAYSRLISREDCPGILNLPPDGYGLWKPKGGLGRSNPWQD